MTEAQNQSETALIRERTLGIIRELLAELGSDRARHHFSSRSSLDADLGLGSLERVELLLRCEAAFHTRLADRVVQEAETPEDLVQAVLHGGKDDYKPHYRIDQPSSPAPPAPESARTWVEVIRRQAEVNHDRVHIHLLDGESGQDITYGQLFEKASQVAAGLCAAGLKPNETVAIMLPTCSDFFFAFFGVMLAGGIPVPIYPPARPDKIEEYVRRQVLILRNAEVRFLVSHERVKAVAKILRLSVPTLMQVTTVDSLSQTGSKPPASDASETAFIQYTSGSTGNPKGVVLSHANVLANVQGIGWAVKFRPTDIVVSWLPLYHDMGLIGSWLFSVYFGAPITVLSPLDFLSRPERWLWAMHYSRGSLCPAPNFSYELCARKIPEHAIEGLDLSTWRIAINAGEAVLPDTLARFAQRFERYGFRAESFVPCYGLAESSVALAFPPIERRAVVDRIRRDVFEADGKSVPADPAESNVLRFVANGVALPGHEVKIVDPEGCEVGERVQGRVLFRGLSMTAGYFHNPEATAAIRTSDGWLDSGDLGYWAGGELYVTGRSKDLIIKSGRNIIPQEIEEAVAEVRGVRRGCVAAFGTVDRESGTERLVVVAETRATLTDELQRIESEVIRNVEAVLGIPPDSVALVPPQSIPKTSSGKIRRSLTRSFYEHGQLRRAKKSPWRQIARLWLENLGSGIELGLASARKKLRRAYVSVLLFAVPGLFGLVARLLPRRAAARLVRPAAGWLLSLAGYEVIVQSRDCLPKSQPAILLANRAGVFDPLILAAVLPAPFLIADGHVLSSLPRRARFLLRPLVAPLINGDAVPPGGILREAIRRGLEDGHSVLAFPDGPAGVPAHLSRFRLDAIHAALATGSPIYPIGLRETSDIFRQELSLAGNEHHAAHSEPTISKPQVIVGEPIPLQLSKEEEVVKLRDRARSAISTLCE